MLNLRRRIKTWLYAIHWRTGYRSSCDEETWAKRVQPLFLKDQGLKPYHNFLDIGCGYLRGTVELVDYLENGRFFGIDVSRSNIRKAKDRVGQECRNRPILVVGSLLDISRFWPTTKFDFVLAASVFTHLWPAEVEGCLQGVSRVMKGKFFTTVFKDNTVKQYDGWCGSCVDHTLETHQSAKRVTRWRNYLAMNFCYNTVWISEVAKKYKLEVREIGPTQIGQFMLEIKPIE